MKKTVAVVLSLLVLFNVLGTTVFDVHSSAVITEAVATYILTMAGGFVVGGLGTLLGKETQDNAWKFSAMHSDLIYDINNNAIQNGELIQVYDSGNNVYFTPASGLSDDEQEFAQFFCDKLNNCSYGDRLIAGFKNENGDSTTNLNHGEINAEIYSQFKSDVVNAFYDYVTKKQREEAGNAVADATGATPYDFNFTGPVQPYNHVIMDNGEMIGATVNGYNLYAPWCVYKEGKTATPVRSCGGLEFDWCNGDDERGYRFQFSTYANTCYGCGYYFVYGGKMYYWSRQSNSGTSSDLIGSYSLTIDAADSYHFGRYTDVNGVTLSQAGATSAVGLYFGFYVVTSPGVPYTPTEIMSSGDISEQGTLTGIELAPPKTPAEALIGEGMAIGIIPDDATLTINSQGEITQVDGIDLSSIENLINQLKNGQLDFDSFETYLSTIEMLLGKGNENTTAIKDILQNIQNKYNTVNDKTAFINAINAALQAQTKAITDALSTSGSVEGEEDNTIPDTLTGIDEKLGELNDVFSSEGELLDYLEQIKDNTYSMSQALEGVSEGELAIEKQDIEADLFSIQHTGLPQAADIVSHITLVNQCKALLDNILNYDEYTTIAPVFKFYYDSNKDGEKEMYTAFDLSFLETTLSNENLVDKERFQRSMTVRQFIQYLMILLCYVAFAIKVFHKLPSLVGGAETSTSDALEVKSLK